MLKKEDDKPRDDGIEANESPPFIGGSEEDGLDFFETKDSGIWASKDATRAELEDQVHFRVIPRALIPTFYRIQIRPLFDVAEEEATRFTVPGTVSILVDSVSDTNVIQLHSKFITIDEAATKITLKGSELVDIGISNQNTSATDGVHVITTMSPLQFGSTYEIYLEFTAKVFRDRLNGLYLSNYTNPETNETELLVVTHFEPQGARQLFPSFDEPDLKARFEIIVGRREGYSSLSNMDLIESTPITNLPGWMWDHYQTTVKMSTYLVALAVSKYGNQAAESELFDGKAVKIWAAKHHMEKGGGVYAAEIAAKILKHYETYFNTTYPLPKMDSVAVPHFEVGAMENFGLNTYKERYLLYFDGESTQNERYGVCSVVAHELSHQFFGDLVTCKSWSQLWLNEGFAEYVQNIGANAVCPEFDPWNSFASQTLQPAMLLDQSSETHPLVNDTDNTAKFTKITYNKGASVLRMMNDFLGESTFVKGLQSYLHRLSFSSAHTDDLFATLQEQVTLDDVSLPHDVPLPDIMECWTKQAGYPLVRVTALDNTTISLSQEEFQKPKYLRDSRELSDKGQGLWWIPLKVTTKASPVTSQNFWIPSYIKSMERTDVDTTDWVIVNSKAIGYYRVLYDDKITASIKKQLDMDHSEIDANTRSQFLDDYFNFAYTNYVQVQKVLDLTTYLDTETDYGVWNTVLTNLKRSMKLLSSTPALTSLQHYLQPKLNSVLNSIGLEQEAGETGARVMLRALLLNWACTLNDEQCQDYSLKLFRAWMEEPITNTIPVDIQSTVYCTAIRSDTDDSIWDFVVEKYDQESGNQRKRLLTSLACSRDVTKIQKLFKFIFMSHGTTLDEIDGFIRKLATTSEGRGILLKIISEKPKRILDIYQYEKKVAKILTLLSSYYHGEKESEGIRALLVGNDAAFALSEKSLRSILELIDDNQFWMSKFYMPMKSWLDDQTSPIPRENYPKYPVRH